MAEIVVRDQTRASQLRTICIAAQHHLLSFQKNTDATDGSGCKSAKLCRWKSCTHRRVRSSRPRDGARQNRYTAACPSSRRRQPERAAGTQAPLGPMTNVAIAILRGPYWRGRLPDPPLDEAFPPTGGGLRLAASFPASRPTARCRRGAGRWSSRGALDARRRPGTARCPGV